MITRSYPASNAYGLTNVPTIFWIAQDGEIEVSSVGWVKADFEEINRRMADGGKEFPRQWCSNRAKKCGISVQVEGRKTSHRVGG